MLKTEQVQSPDCRKVLAEGRWEEAWGWVEGSDELLLYAD